MVQFFFFGGNFGGDKLGFMAKFWWKVVVGFLEGKRGKIDEKEERETYFFYIFFLRIFFLYYLTVKSILFLYYFNEFYIKIEITLSVL